MEILYLYIYLYVYILWNTRVEYTKSIRIGCRYGDSFIILNSGVLNLCGPCHYKSTLTRGVLHFFLFIGPIEVTAAVVVRHRSLYLAQETHFDKR